MQSPNRSPETIKNTQKDLIKRAELKYSLLPEDLIKLGHQYVGLESPIDISFQILTEATLPPMEWVNFDIPPKRMKIANSGITAILSAKWHGPRPYLTKGPLTECYVFSQLHFHWGEHCQEGSEHTMDGQSFPLEAHVMFFKNTYLTQEDAMKKVDGTVTVAYLFTLQEEDNEDLNSVISALDEIQKPLTSYNLELLPLTKFLHSFSNDYFMYWGNVIGRSMLWIINRVPLGISLRQLSSFQSMMGSNGKPIMKNFRSTKEINHRIVYHINPLMFKNSLLHEIQYEPVEKEMPKSVHLKTSEIFVGQVEVENPTDQFPKEHNFNLEEMTENNERSDNNDININISVLKGKVSEFSLQNYNKDIEDKTLRDEEDLNTSFSSIPSGKLETRNKSQIKLQLATALLNLEKGEGNDCSFLEKYIQNNFKQLQLESCHDTKSIEKEQADEILPSVKSLHLKSIPYDSNDHFNAPTSKEVSKSDTHCFKGSPSMAYETDSEKNSVAESNKSGWSSINSIIETDDKRDGEEKNPQRQCPSRPMTSDAILADRRLRYEEKYLINRTSQNRLDRNIRHWATSSLDSESVPSRSNSITRQEQMMINKQLSRNKSKLGANDYKPSGNTVNDESRYKIRSTQNNSMSKLTKTRGTPTEMYKQMNNQLKTRPAWRY